MKKFLVTLAVGLIVGFGLWQGYKKSEEKKGLVKLEIGEAVVWVEVRDTEQGRSRGLSDRKKLAEDEGMLFVFDDLKLRQFWMNQMRFDLDMVWIEGERVAGVTENVPAPKAGEQPVRVWSSQAVDKVLEVNSGWVKKHQVEAGDKIRL